MFRRICADGKLQSSISLKTNQRKYHTLQTKLLLMRLQITLNRNTFALAESRETTKLRRESSSSS